MMLEFMTVARVKKVRRSGGLFGLWYLALWNPNEGDKIWNKVFTIEGGVDFFFSDKPLQAMQARDKLQQKSKSKTCKAESARASTTKKAAPK